jgi:hypothetical protein
LFCGISKARVFGCVLAISITAVATIAQTALADPPRSNHGTFEGDPQAWDAISCRNLEEFADAGLAHPYFFAPGVPASFTSIGECVQYLQAGGTLLVRVAASDNETGIAYYVVDREGNIIGITLSNHTNEPPSAGCEYMLATFRADDGEVFTVRAEPGETSTVTIPAGLFQLDYRVFVFEGNGDRMVLRRKNSADLPTNGQFEGGITSCP